MGCGGYVLPVRCLSFLALLLLSGCDAPSSKPEAPPLTKDQQAAMDRATTDLIKTAGSAAGRFQFMMFPGGSGIVKGDTMTGEVWIYGGVQGVPPHWVKLPETP